MKSLAILALLAMVASTASAAVMLNDNWTVTSTYGWSTNTVDTTTFTTGTNSLKCVMAADGSISNAGMGIVLSPDAMNYVANGQPQTLSFDYKVDRSTVNSDTFGLTMGFIPNNWGGAWIAGLGGEPNFVMLTADNAWHTATFTGTPAAGTPLQWVKIFRPYWSPSLGGGTNATINIDNVRIVPEPATMSLLGLGLLAIRRRRAA